MSRPFNSAPTETIATTAPQSAATDDAASSLQVLLNGQEQEALEFLRECPVHTVLMSGRIRDHGLESYWNRGKFYASRSARGELQGVALIGHHIIFAACSEASLAAFAHQARRCPDTRIILGEQEAVARFWPHYAGANSPLTATRYLMLEQTSLPATNYEVNGLRPATFADLNYVLDAHALMVEAERGSNPLKVDAAGFRERLAQRVAQGRAWVWVEDGRLIFKADVISETPDVFYLEGIYVNPADRGQGYGLRCLTHLSRQLLKRTKSVCLLVNEQNQSAQNLYRRAGFKLHSMYNTVHLSAPR